MQQPTKWDRLSHADQRRRRATRETTMDRDRRAFLKTTSLAAAAAAAGLPAATEAVAQARSASVEMKELPKGLVLATLRRPDSYGLGLRSDRGILDVVAAEQDFREGAPTTTDALLPCQAAAYAPRRLSGSSPGR